MKKYGIDVESELMRILNEEMNKSKEDTYLEIKEILNIQSFMEATNNNLDMLFKYMYSPTNGIRLSNTQVGEFIKDEYGDDFYLRREQVRNEEYEREIQNNKRN